MKKTTINTTNETSINHKEFFMEFVEKMIAQEETDLGRDLTEDEELILLANFSWITMVLSRMEEKIERTLTEQEGIRLLKTLYKLPVPALKNMIQNEDLMPMFLI